MRFQICHFRTPGLLATLALLVAPLGAQGDDSDARARAIHERVLTLDTHVDISPANFRLGAPNYGEMLPRTQVDLVKMEQGGLDAAFLIVYVGQSDDLSAAGFARAHEQAMEKFAAVHRLVDSIAPGRAELALTAADAHRIHDSGKRVILIGVENGFPIGADVTNVARFHELGGRYMSLAHNGHSQLSDSNTGERDGVWLHNGLSDLGREVIREMNRVGMMIDISHPSKQSMMQTLELTRAPIIASHSGARALCDHSRNLDDEQLRALAANGGVLLERIERIVDAPRSTAPAAATTPLLVLAMGLGPVGAAFWLWDIGTKRGDLVLLEAMAGYDERDSTSLDEPVPRYSAEIATGGPINDRSRMFMALRMQEQWPTMPTERPNTEYQAMGNVVTDLWEGGALRISGGLSYGNNNVFPSQNSASGYQRWLWDRVTGTRAQQRMNAQIGARLTHLISTTTYYEIQLNTLHTTNTIGSSPVPGWIPDTTSLNWAVGTIVYPNNNSPDRLNYHVGNDNFTDQRSSTISLEGSSCSSRPR